MCEGKSGVECMQEILVHVPLHLLGFSFFFVFDKLSPSRQNVHSVTRKLSARKRVKTSRPQQSFSISKMKTGFTNASSLFNHFN